MLDRPCPLLLSPLKKTTVPSLHPRRQRTPRIRMAVVEIHLPAACGLVGTRRRVHGSGLAVVRRVVVRLQHSPWDDEVAHPRPVVPPPLELQGDGRLRVRIGIGDLEGEIESPRPRPQQPLDVLPRRRRHTVTEMLLETPPRDPYFITNFRRHEPSLHGSNP